MTPSQRLHQIGTRLDLAAIYECAEELNDAIEELNVAHLSGLLTEQKLAAAKVKKFAERVSHLAGGVESRLSAHLQRKPKAA